MPTLTQIEYALSVEKWKHFGKAAKEKHITQPTLSQQIQKLEDELGIILFDRVKKPIKTTPEGEIFMAQAKIVLRENEKLVHLSKQSLSKDVSGEFKLGIIPTVSSHLLPHFIKPFSKAYPGISLFIEEMKTETILHELSNDNLDAAILATPIHEEGFKIHPLYYEPFLAYICKNHPLLHKKNISRNELDLKEMWLLQDGHCFKDQVFNFCAVPASKRKGGNHSIQNHVSFQSGSLDTLKRIVQNAGGLTLIPALMAMNLNSKEKAHHVRPFKAPIPTREISLIYRRDHWKLGMIKAVETTLLKNLPPSVSKHPIKEQQVLDVC